MSAGAVPPAMSGSDGLSRAFWKEEWDHTYLDCSERWNHEELLEETDTAPSDTWTSKRQEMGTQDPPNLNRDSIRLEIGGDCVHYIISWKTSGALIFGLLLLPCITYGYTHQQFGIVTEFVFQRILRIHASYSPMPE